MYLPFETSNLNVFQINVCYLKQWIELVFSSLYILLPKMDHVAKNNLLYSEQIQCKVLTH